MPWVYLRRITCSIQQSQTGDSAALLFYEVVIAQISSIRPTFGTETSIFCKEDDWNKSQRRRTFSSFHMLDPENVATFTSFQGVSQGTRSTRVWSHTLLPPYIASWTYFLSCPSQVFESSFLHSCFLIPQCVCSADRDLVIEILC